MKQANKYIQFEVELAMAPAKAMGASMGVDFSSDTKDSGGETDSSKPSNDADYKDLTEDDLVDLMRALGG